MSSVRSERQWCGVNMPIVPDSEEDIIRIRGQIMQEMKSGSLLKEWVHYTSWFVRKNNYTVYCLFDILTPMSSIQDLANDLVVLCREHRYEEIYEKYYTEESRGVEAFGMNGADPVTVWKTALIEKAKKRAEMTDVVGGEVSDASVVNGNQFIVYMSIEAKKGDAAPEKHEEYVLYTVKDGKIVEEKFFYFQ